MPSVFERIITLTRQLYPKGLAFKMPYGSTFETLHRALALSENRAWDDATSILFDILPDNADFEEDDATAWEIRLGMITATGVSLEDRKEAIKRKMNFPGTVVARQSSSFLQDQLQAAGFNVFVYDNRFSNYPDGYITKTPFEVSGDPSVYNLFRHGQRRHGQKRHGAFIWKNKIVNHIDESLDLPFEVGSNYRSTFYVGGEKIGSEYAGETANVFSERKNEFRQLILKIKPAQTVGFLFINYI